MRRLAGFLVVLTAISGCSVSTEIRGLNPFSAAPAEAPAAQPEVPVDPVARIESLEIGQAYRGVIATATGLADLAGFHHPELRLLNEGRPAADGMIELEMVARPPEQASLSVDAAARRLIAAAFLPEELVRAARGVRVIGATNAVARPF
ncbi:MAG: hypothetical protein KatS3mg118_0078 [Paracoccaceae bacterium]|nr:MAG: hypothetical protein KatS3mg118_0078 [Paracoccaceae bacterium]